MDKVLQILKVTKHLSKNDLMRISNEILRMLSKASGVYGASATNVKKCRKCDAENIVKFGKDKNGKGNK